MPLRMAHDPAAVGGLLLIDTDVLIDDLREQPLAASAITIAELDVARARRRGTAAVGCLCGGL